MNTCTRTHAAFLSDCLMSLTRRYYSFPEQCNRDDVTLIFGNMAASTSCVFAIMARPGKHCSVQVLHFD